MRVMRSGFELVVSEELSDHGGVEMEMLSEARRGTIEEDQAIVTPLFPVRIRSRPPRAACIARATVVSGRKQAMGLPVRMIELARIHTRSGMANLAYNVWRLVRLRGRSPPDATLRDQPAPIAEFGGQQAPRSRQFPPVSPFSSRQTPIPSHHNF